MTSEMAEEPQKGLFETWLDLEYASGKQLKDILAEVNAHCGTAYQYNWPSKMAARNYALERVPDAVRRYMLRRVLPGVAEVHALPELERLVKQLT